LAFNGPLIFLFLSRNLTTSEVQDSLMESIMY
jgi:hypothetical protein